jgi:hypothetical protein
MVEKKNMNPEEIGSKEEEQAGLVSLLDVMWDLAVSS